MIRILQIAAVICLITFISAGITAHASTTSSYKVYNFNHEFTNSKVKDLLTLLSEADEGDKVDIIIDSPGGSISSLGKVLRGLRTTKADVSCLVNGMAASAAAVLAWNCPKLLASPKSFVLFHKAAYNGFYVAFAAGRLTSDTLRRLADNLDTTDQILKIVYLSGAMTEVEQERYDRGADVVVSATKVVKRHNKLQRGKK